MRLLDRSTIRAGSSAHRPFALLLCAVVIVVVLHALRPDVDPAVDYVSQYGNEGWSWLFGTALILCALGLFALGAALREVENTHRGPNLLRASAVLFGIVAVVPSDRHNEVVSTSLSGYIHGTAAIAAISAVTVAAALISLRKERWGFAASRRSGPGPLPVALGALVLVVASFAFVPDADGLRQRALLIVVFSWLLMTAHQVRSMPWARAAAPCGPE